MYDSKGLFAIAYLSIELEDKMLDKEKSIGILALNRLIENGDITVNADQIYTLYWVSYQILKNSKTIDFINEAEKVVGSSISIK